MDSTIKYHITPPDSAALSGLTTTHVQIIDDIIGRVPSTTMFLFVFVAYNAVFEERGMDKAHDPVYYKFLLKLGSVEGPNYGKKWEAVKERQGYVAELPSMQVPQKRRTGWNKLLKKLARPAYFLIKKFHRWE